MLDQASQKSDMVGRARSQAVDLEAHCRILNDGIGLLEQERPAAAANLYFGLYPRENGLIGLPWSPAAVPKLAFPIQHCSSRTILGCMNTLPDVLAFVLAVAEV